MIHMYYYSYIDLILEKYANFNETSNKRSSERKITFNSEDILGKFQMQRFLYFDQMCQVKLVQIFLKYSF